MYIDQLIKQSEQQLGQIMFANQQFLGKPKGMAYSSLVPEWEVTTPQHVVPNPYSLAQMGYRTNELVFTAINVRADTISEGPMTVWNKGGNDEPTKINNHKLPDLLENPCPGVSEQTFWKIVETYLGIAGFSAWEKERNNLGEVVRLWPMRPDWCSFMRGQGKPVRAIRYQPQGLPFFDIDIGDILLFSYFDPLWPLLKPLSPSMVVLEMVNVDNNMTDMINNFIVNGAFLGGVLSTENQVLQEAEAEVYKRRWREAHGGKEHAGDIAVIGKGLKFQTTNNTFRDMVFPEVDARSEARITMAFRVPPMLMGAKIGLDRSTYSNYEEARKGFYEGPMTAEWKFLSGIVKDQLMPDFENEPKLFVCLFETKEIKALQEDRGKQVDRADKMYKGKWAKLNEARKEAGLDPIDGEEGESFYQDSNIENTDEELIEGELVNGKKPKQLPEPKEKPKTRAQLDLEEAEEKKYTAFANKRIKEGKFDDLSQYEFLYLSKETQRKLVERFEGKAILLQLKEAVNAD